MTDPIGHVRRVVERAASQRNDAFTEEWVEYITTLRRELAYMEKCVELVRDAASMNRATVEQVAYEAAELLAELEAT